MTVDLETEGFREDDCHSALLRFVAVVELFLDRAFFGAVVAGGFSVGSEET